MKGRTPAGVDWGFGSPTTVHFSVDPITGEKVTFSQEQMDALEAQVLARHYAMLDRHRRATMMIDYRAATSSGSARLHWRREQLRVAIRVYQRAK